VDVVVNSGSHNGTEGGNLFNKDVNNPFKVLEFTSSSVFFLFVEFTEGSEGVLGINDGLVRLSGEFPGSFFSIHSNFEVNSEFLEVGHSLLFVNKESSDFFLGLDLILSGVKSGLDFVGFELSGTFFKMGLESVEHGVDFVVEGTGKVGGIDGGHEVFSIEGFSVVVGNNFTSSGGSFVHVFEVGEVGVGIFVKIDTGVVVFRTGLEELFHGVSFEEMFVFGEFSREGRVGLGKDWSVSSSFGSGEFNSEDTNSNKSIFVFFELLDEELVGFTSGDVELD